MSQAGMLEPCYALLGSTNEKSTLAAAPSPMFLYHLPLNFPLLDPGWWAGPVPGAALRASVFRAPSCLGRQAQVSVRSETPPPPYP